MSGLNHILRAAAAIDAPIVDRAMAAALPTADSDAVSKLGRILLKRRHSDGTTGLILQFHRLPEDLQNTIIDHADALAKPLRQAAGRRNTHGPTNAMRVIQESQSTHRAYLVGEQLRHGSQALRDQAVACLLLLAESCATDSRPGNVPMIEPIQAAFLQSAVEEAIDRYEAHDHPKALVAMATLMPRWMPAVHTALNNAKHAAIAPLRTLLTKAHDPAIRHALLAMLGYAPLAQAAMAGLRQCAVAGTLGPCLKNYHMLALPAARAAVQSAKAPESYWPAEEHIRAMRAHYRRGLPTLVTCLPSTPAQKIEQLDSLRKHGDTTTRLFALRHLLHIARQPGGKDAGRIITRFTADPDVSLARIALGYLIGSPQRDLSRLLASLINSEHEEISHLASRRLAPLGFKRLWELWPRLDASRRLAAGRALIKINPHLHRTLAGKLQQTHAAVRLRALSMIHDLNQGDYFNQALIHMTHDADTKVASAAVKALATANGPDVTAALRDVLEHADSRMRANAIEALAQKDSAGQMRQFMLMADKEENRPRANAIAALMHGDSESATDALVTMLADQRPAHRTSALWLVQTMGLVEVAHNVAEMSITDPDRAVKQRADRVVQGLIGLIDEQDIEALNQAA
jgi:hypothetical protein